MADLPIIFSAPMVRALLDGRKAQTRRLAWRRYKSGLDQATSWMTVVPGDRLYVRESFCSLLPLEKAGPSGNQIVKPALASYVVFPDGTQQYRSGFSSPPTKGEPKFTSNIKWRPSIHLPRWASRLTLVVKATKIERLQDIGWNDAIAEGIARGDPMPEVPNSHGTIWHNGMTDPLNDWSRDPTQAFRDLWVAIHGPDAWAENPEVVALTFSVHKVNIDQMAKEVA